LVIDLPLFALYDRYERAGGIEKLRMLERCERQLRRWI
jgi:hypothetical protein